MIIITKLSRWVYGVLTPLSTILQFYLTLCTFSFGINESSLSDTRCPIQDVVSPHCRDKRMDDITRDILCRTTLSWRHIIGMLGNKHFCKQRKHSNCLMSIHLYYVLRIHGHIIVFKDIFSIFPLHISPNKKSIVGRLDSDTESDRTATTHWAMNGNK